MCPLFTMTGVMVQTVQFLDKVVDVPVVYNDRGYGPDSAVPGQGCCSACCFYDRCTWFQTCRKRLEVPQMQFCVAGDVPVIMQRLCGVYGDGAVQVFFRRIFTAFSASSSELRPCQFMTEVMWTYTHAQISLNNHNHNHNHHNHHKAQTGCALTSFAQLTVFHGMDPWRADHSQVGARSATKSSDGSAPCCGMSG